jgi:predicted RNA-binding protein with PIN domain
MIVIIDGHNLIAKMPNISLGDANDEAQLIQILRRYRARTGYRIVVVFDAGVAFQLGSKSSKGGLTVQYAPHSVTADALIKKRLRRIANPNQTLVVTSDREVQRAARQARTRVITSSEFAQNLQILQETSVALEEDDAPLSAAEVDDWLTLFNERK